MKPTILCILDGWGESDQREHNAIAQAHTPNWDALRAAYPFSTLSASEGDVGLPAGQMGNSEVGHMNIGAGRVVLQDLVRIDKAVADGSLAQNAALKNYIAALQQSGGACHLMGLLSDGGVHSHQAHMAALANIIAAAGVPVMVHAFLDGRDTPPQSALGYVQQFLHAVSSIGTEVPPQSLLPQGGRRLDEGAVRSAHNFESPSPNLSPLGGEEYGGSPLPESNKSLIRIATLSGRYYAMDRDKRWERVSAAYEAMVEGKGTTANDAIAAVQQSYAAQKTDEFMLPAVIGDYHGMRDGDGILMANFRADRARQLLEALTIADFTGFERKRWPRFAAKLGMVEYSDLLSPLIPAIFTKESLRNNLGEMVSSAGLKQLRIAETEKYAHVTFFFSGGREEKYPGEDRILVPSPKVATYDLKPEMSAFEVTDKLINAIEHEVFDFIVVNYANTDMVGHSGDLQAAIKAVEAVDACLGKLSEAVLKKGGTLLITADHGNAECLHDDDGDQPHTAHTLNPVPCLLVSDTHKNAMLTNGVLADIAPTLCTIMGLKQPKEMTGKSLLLEVSHAVA